MSHLSYELCVRNGLALCHSCDFGKAEGRKSYASIVCVIDWYAERMLSIPNTMDKFEQLDTYITHTFIGEDLYVDKMIEIYHPELSSQYNTFKLLK